MPPSDHEHLDYRACLRATLGDGDKQRIESIQNRQTATVRALLDRLYSDDEGKREIGLLADEVGLGKTFVALGVAFSVLKRRKAAGKLGPVLVITPNAHALFRKWQREAERFRSLVAPKGEQFEIKCAETPPALAHALRSAAQTLVIARMPALSGRLHDRDVSDRAVLHWLFHQPEFKLESDRRKLLTGMDGFDLRKSGEAWQAAEDSWFLGFNTMHIDSAWRRLKTIDPQLSNRIAESFARVRDGWPRRTCFGEDIREVGRAALGESIVCKLPLVIVDEIHNWKNSPQSWWRFQHMLGGRVDRLLGLSATPFQLGPNELINVLDLRRCLSLKPARRAYLDARVEDLRSDLAAAENEGKRLRIAWQEVADDDVVEVEAAWLAQSSGEAEGISLPPRLKRAIDAGHATRNAHRQLQRSLHPFVIRHRRQDSRRAWWIGRDAAPGAKLTSGHGSAVRWRPGLDVRGDAELVHYMMMRAVQEQKSGRGATTLGADLGGSYDFFREGELKRQQVNAGPTAQRYLALVDEATGTENGHEHPKVALTADRAFRSWEIGEKTLIFCFNVATTDAVRQAVQRRIDARQNKSLALAFRCKLDELPLRLANFQKRLYNHTQSLYLLFQDHPLAGPDGRLPANLALMQQDLETLSQHLGRIGPPKDKSRFDRRRLLAATEQVLVAKWRKSSAGRDWLDRIGSAWKLNDSSWDQVVMPSWPSVRRKDVEGMSAEHEAEPLVEDDDAEQTENVPKQDNAELWRVVLDSRAGRSALAPYLLDEINRLPSILSLHHAQAMARLPAKLRALAARMLRRMIRLPGFLARFLLEDAKARPELHSDGDEAEAGWTALIQRRWTMPMAGAESARDRFSAYLDTLLAAVNLDEQIRAYEDASRNRQVVARVTGAVAGIERDRLFVGFNMPLVPEVLIVTTVGQEGIDLHRECRHVIHHDLPWNPATLEQGTGRVDRIGSKAERIAARGVIDANLDVVVPYIAGTYDEHRFRVVHGRAHLFEVTMGGDYTVDGHRPAEDAMESAVHDDDAGLDGSAWAALPQSMADDLRINLEAEVDC